MFGIKTICNNLTRYAIFSLFNYVLYSDTVISAFTELNEFREYRKQKPILNSKYLLHLIHHFSNIQLDLICVGLCSAESHIICLWLELC